MALRKNSAAEENRVLQRDPQGRPLRCVKQRQTALKTYWS